MPPEAISRSRTYFPKIWGNTRVYRTALLPLSLALGCRTVPGPVRTHSIRAHWIPGCAPAGARSAQIDLQALGDFDPTQSAFDLRAGSDTDAPLVVPDATKAVLIDATDGSSSDRRFRGAGAVDVTGDIDVSLWPEGACVLSDGASGYPGAKPGQAMGVTRDGRVLLVAGGEGDATVGASALVVDLGTGVAAAVAETDGTHGAGATVTPFGANLLVAGGYRLEGPMDDRVPLGSAEVFDVETRGFERLRIALEQARFNHAAVELVSGETLLVGGEGPSGRLINTLEALSPSTREYRTSGLTTLQFPRRGPIALRLSDGRVLVAGGTSGLPADTPVDRLQWLSADGSQTDGVLSLSESPDPPVRGRAFVAMPGGSVLAAGGCVLRAPLVGEECGACDVTDGDVRKPGGCPSREVQWITRDSIATILPDALTVDAPHPALVAGSEGRPWLFTDTARPRRENAQNPATDVLKFDPFLGRFITGTSIAPTNAASRFVTIDSGLFVWLERRPAGTGDGGTLSDRGSLSGFRHGTRGPLSPNLTPLLQTDLDGVALDRDPSRSYDPTTSTVTLASGTALVLTDTTYADVHLGIALTAGTPPVVRLGDRSYGGSDCTWPAGAGASLYKVDRDGDRVTLSVGSGVRDCLGPRGRVSVSLVGSGASVTVSSITVNRSRPK